MNYSYEPRRNRGANANIGVLVVVFLLLSQQAALAAIAQIQGPATPTDIRKLELGKPIERELKGGESHTYEITLDKDQYLHVEVEQLGVSVAIMLLSPEGKKLTALGASGLPLGTRRIDWIAEAVGSYQISVSIPKETVTAGKYTIQTSELRAATEPDRALQDTVRLNEELRQFFLDKKYDEALVVAEKVLAIREKAFGKEHPLVANALANLARVYDAKSDITKAEQTFLRALEIQENAFGKDHPNLLPLLNNLALVAKSNREIVNVQSLYKRALEIQEKALGKEHPAVATALENLAIIYSGSKYDFAKAEQLVQRALQIREKTLGREHPDVANSLQLLSLCYRQGGNYVMAEALLQRALEIREKSLGREDPQAPYLLSDLAGLYEAKGDDVKAEAMYQRALEIQEKTIRVEGSAFFVPFNNLVNLYFLHGDKGDLAKAEVLCNRVLELAERALGKDHYLVYFVLKNIVSLYEIKNDDVKVEALLQRRLQIAEKVYGKESPNISFDLSDLASFYEFKGDDAKAEAFLQRRLEIEERAYGKKSPEITWGLLGFGDFYGKKGDYTRAESYYLNALALQKNIDYEKGGYLEILGSLEALAALYYFQNNYAKAEPLFKRALDLEEQFLGDENPDFPDWLNSKALFFRGQGDIAKAIALQIRANELVELEFARNLVAGSERQKLAYIAKTSDWLDSTISLHVQSAPDNVDACRAALSIILRRKGRALDVMTDTISALRRNASQEDQRLLDELTDVRAQLADLVNQDFKKYGIEKYKAKIKTFEEKEDDLENQISRRGAEFRGHLLPIKLDVIQKTIPDDTALIEFAVYRPIETQTHFYNRSLMASKKKYGASRYVAYMLTRAGEAKWADLGEAEPIDKLVVNLRKALRERKSDIEHEVKPLARQLDEKVMQPVRALLGDKKRLLISPDGTLNLIPFDALVDENNHYLVENYSISYLSSGRDLLRLQETKPNNKTAVVFANPNFDKSTTKARASEGEERILQRVNPSENQQSRIARRVEDRPGPKLGSVQLQPLEPLPGSAKEGKQLKTLLPNATMFMEMQATETALKQVSKPSILHISTHGGFLEDVPKPDPNERRGLLVRPAGLGGFDEAIAPKVKFDNPLLRSGLFFAGANTGKSGDDDGVLTALEAAGLDLYGTKLVVLSACDTGIGEVKNGDGVYGLRRAFVLAGAETQVMSLWPVSDEDTRELMIDYYKRLLAGEGRGEALRQVRLKMLASSNRKHPFYWASFIQSGEWANLDGKR